MKIYGFGLAISAAILAAAFVVWREGIKKRYDEEKLIDLLIVTALSGLLGARIYYILTNFSDFSTLNPFFWPLIFHFPGLNWIGAIFGGLIVLYWFCRKEKWSFWETGDMVVLGVSLGEMIIRFGNFLTTGQLTELYKSLSMLIIFVVLIILKKRFQVFLLYFILWSIAIFFLEKKMQIYCLLFFVIAVMLSYWRSGRSIKKDMFKFPVNILRPIEDYLKKQKAATESKMASVSSEDPFNDTDRLNDNASIDTDVKEQVGHQRVEVIKLELSRNLVRIRKALTKIKVGKYGLCERCGSMIDTDRLALLPEAEFCLKCEKKKEK